MQCLRLSECFFHSTWNQLILSHVVISENTVTDCCHGDCDTVTDLSLESFPADFEDRRVIYWHGVDNEHRKICKLISAVEWVSVGAMSVCLSVYLSVCLSV